ncbi:MAG TPA: folylpolyglutamate synthase/dihydrofolate synthase family protein [Candidatus Acidoferrales bacterium]|nr:folylpolyglutamate synthase/dihydrofolate synthase family protein [Candidatus Acidoferrales bacterium]
MKYSEAIQFLYSLRLFGAKFGLENTLKLAALAGEPQKKLRFIHVAGTNGKGSTCAMLESIYRAAGLRVGLFTSPHLVSFRERIQIGRQWIPEKEVVRLVDKFRVWLEQFPKDHHPTFFEVITVMALEFFSDHACDVVIWETGLGGRLDATNIVTPLASVITNIALDHQQWLGDTLDKIAAEKAGIIKPGIPVVTATDEPSALAVIKKTAKEKKAPLTTVAKSKLEAELAGALSLSGEHQRHNAALALATVEILQKQIPVTKPQIIAGLHYVEWPGRLQLMETDGKRILLDGAHNVAGAKALRDAIEKNFPTDDRTLILGILDDKDWRQICELLAPIAETILAVPVLSNRTAKPKELAGVCRTANPAAKVSVCDSLDEAFQKMPLNHLTIVAGSLYLVGEALERLGYFPPATRERELNEWNVKPSAPAG